MLTYRTRLIFGSLISVLLSTSAGQALGYACYFSDAKSQDLYEQYDLGDDGYNMADRYLNGFVDRGDYYESVTRLENLPYPIPPEVFAVQTKRVYKLSAKRPNVKFPGADMTVDIEYFQKDGQKAKDLPDKHLPGYCMHEE